MKRYIKASISPSAPTWLRQELGSKRFGNEVKEKLLSKYHIAIDRANFTHEPTGPASIPIYLLQTDFGESVYCPGANDNSTGFINGRNRRFGAIAKSKLPEMAIDVVYVNPDEEGNTFEKKDRYQDPRYTYRHSRKGNYAGQYMTQEYLGYDKGYRDAGWSKAGMTPSNENRARDKSGYKIPSPSEMLSNYYSKFPERVTDKLDNVYEKILDVKDMLMAADFNKPLDKPYGRDVYSDAYREFSYVVQKYRSLFNYLDENRQLRGADSDYYISEFASEVRNIVGELKQIKDMLA